SDSNTITIIVGDTSGTIQVVAISACGGLSDTQSLAITVLPSPEPEIQENDLILSTTQTDDSYQWLLDGEYIVGATEPIYLADANGYYQVRVVNSDSCFGLSDSLWVEGASRIEGMRTAINLQLCPNPSSGQLPLQLSTAGFMQCYNLEGKQLVEPMQLKKGLNRFDLAHLPTGVYLIRVVTDEGVQVLKWLRE